MLPPIPVLADYGISPTHGFLPEVLPLTRLPDPYYNKWEAIAANLQALILSKRLRGVVDRLPVLSTIGLEHDAEWRRAYSLLSFMAHGYIWAGDSPSDRLPPPIAVPLLKVSQRLEVPPVATYAAVCLWNFKPLFVDEDIDNLENLATLNTFTGSIDESWFYLVSVAMEARGAPIIPLMLTAIAAARDNDAHTVTRCLRTFAERLDDLGSLLQRMHESCDPVIFYNRIRPFLAGSKNMADAGLPLGVIYEDGSGTETYRQYSGGSNAQSSIFQFFDIALGIEHRPTGEKRGRADESEREGHAAPPKHNFIMDMRRYMPGPHARFLGDIQTVSNIRGFVESRHKDTQLHIAYDACLSMLRVLRDKHIAIVTRYIVVPSREVRARSRSPEATRRKLNLATASRQTRPKPSTVGIAFSPEEGARGDGKGESLKGTGGTALISFLKQARDETGEPAVEEWAQRFMSRQGRPEGRNDFFLGKPEQPVAPEVGIETEEVEVAGLAGTWTMDDDVGGICNY
ncbi:Indoleamine 2,3-dioxygenase [Phialemonium atrogriseum]|uniref:Indoleamine 2,3-dioxygenase n=1 Tax=Phialemonium atrogriseum TaxID=1093897 RepID=A0AAJ0FH16_9PEZI|nr:Indoleamine 2,3-dioxygenase [Phialemonium atrogriseum]KAK1762928.1 Indoleamine 2,3-dioxygenase [Phialemonium atrogriseum]